MKIRKRKAAKVDFELSFLPHNRKTAFKDVLKHRFTFLVEIGLVIFLFSLPYLLSFSLKYYLFLPTAKNVLTDVEYSNFVVINSIIFDAVDILTFSIIGIGLAGVSVIFRKICWQEGIYFWHDFKLGLKENWFHFFIVTLMLSTFRFCAITFSRFDFPIYIKYIPFAVYYLIAPIFMMSLSIASFYQTKIFASLRDGFLFCLKKAIYPLVFGLLVLALRFIHVGISDGIPGFIFLLNIFEIIFVIVLLPMYILAWLNYSLSLFDEFTNKNFYPEYYHRGLVDSFIYKDSKK